jgi:hypothetical protein
LKNTFNFTREGLNRALSAKAGPFTDPMILASSWQNSALNAHTLVRGGKYPISLGRNGKPPADPVLSLDITDELSKSNSPCMQLGRAACMRLGRG